MDTQIFVGDVGSKCPFCGSVLAPQDVTHRKLKINEEGHTAMYFIAVCKICYKVSFTTSYLDFDSGNYNSKTLVYHEDYDELMKEIINGKLTKRQKENLQNCW